MTKQTKYLLFIGVIILLPIAGYLVAHYSAVAILPSQQEGFGYHAIWLLLFTILLLIVPYGMIKFLAYAAHTRNPDEKVPDLKDLPKDKEQWDRSI
jgi:hypothetical protein